MRRVPSVRYMQVKCYKFGTSPNAVDLHRAAKPVLVQADAAIGRPIAIVTHKEQMVGRYFDRSIPIQCLIAQIYDVVISPIRSEEHTSELQSLMRNSYAVLCLKKKTKNN